MRWYFVKVINDQYNLAWMKLKIQVEVFVKKTQTNKHKQTNKKAKKQIKATVNKHKDK